MNFWIVIGGDLEDPQSLKFRDLATLDYRGSFPTWQNAYDAWRSASQQTVDNALRRYFILPISPSMLNAGKV